MFAPAPGGEPPVELELHARDSFRTDRDCAFRLRVRNHLDRDLHVEHHASFLGCRFRAPSVPARVAAGDSGELHVAFRAAEPGDKVLERLLLWLSDADTGDDLGRLVCASTVSFRVYDEGASRVSLNVSGRIAAAEDVEIELPDGADAQIHIDGRIITTGGVKVKAAARSTFGAGGEQGELVALPATYHPPPRTIAGDPARRRPLDRLALVEQFGGEEWVTHLFGTRQLGFSRVGPQRGGGEEVLLRGIPQADHADLTSIISRSMVFELAPRGEDVVCRLGPGHRLSAEHGGASMVAVEGAQALAGAPGELLINTDAVIVLAAPRLVAKTLKLAVGVEREYDPWSRGARDGDGATPAGRLAAVQVRRVNNGTRHSYVLLRRWASLGRGGECSVQVRGLGMGGARARIFRQGRSFYVTPAVGSDCELEVDGAGVALGEAAELVCDSQITIDGAQLRVEEVDYERMKGR